MLTFSKNSGKKNSYFFKTMSPSLYLYINIFLNFMKGIIYKWTCNISNKSYIGQTKNEKDREKSFLNESESYAGEKINNARKKYGLSEGTWTKTVLKRIECSNEEDLRKELNYWEKYYIKEYDTFNNGYNSTDGGDCDFSDEVIEKMREKSLEYWNNLSEEEKELNKKKSSEYWNNLSEEEKEKHKKKCLYNWENMPKESKERMINCHRGHAILRSMYSSKINKGRKLPPKSDEYKQKLSKSVGEKYGYKVIKYSENKSIKIKEYNTLSEASKDNNIKACALSVHKNSVYKGFYWEVIPPKFEEDRIVGVSWCKRLNRWRCKFSGKDLGYFKNKEAAIELLETAKEKKEEGVFEEWCEDIFSHKIALYKKYGEEMRNLG
jgi:group I intron endonuclease